MIKNNFSKVVAILDAPPEIQKERAEKMKSLIISMKPYIEEVKKIMASTEQGESKNE